MNRKGRFLGVAGFIVIAALIAGGAAGCGGAADAGGGGLGGGGAIGPPLGRLWAPKREPESGEAVGVRWWGGRRRRRGIGRRGDDRLLFGKVDGAERRSDLGSGSRSEFERYRRGTKAQERRRASG